MESEKKSGPVPPYVAYKTFKTFLRSIAPTTPGRIDKSVMKTLSGGVQNQLLQALKYLNLIDANGIPQEKLKHLAAAQGDDYAKSLKEVISTSYDFLHDQTVATMTSHQLREAFAKTAATGDTVTKCIAFFIPAAKDAGYVLSPYITERKKRPPSNNKKKAPKGTQEADSSKQPLQNPPPPPPAHTSSWKQMLMDKFPSFDPSWPDDVKAKWFSSFDELMKKGE